MAIEIQNKKGRLTSTYWFSPPWSSSIMMSSSRCEMAPSWRESLPAPNKLVAKDATPVLLLIVFATDSIRYYDCTRKREKIPFSGYLECPICI